MSILFPHGIKPWKAEKRMSNDKSHTPQPSAYYGQYTTHTKRRTDAVIHKGRDLVPTVWGIEQGNTRWVESLAQLKESGGQITFNEDHTEIWLTLPEGYKFGCRMFDQERAACKENAELRTVVKRQVAFLNSLPQDWLAKTNFDADLLNQAVITSKQVLAELDGGAA